MTQTRFIFPSEGSFEPIETEVLSHGNRPFTVHRDNEGMVYVNVDSMDFLNRRTHSPAFSFINTTLHQFLFEGKNKSNLRCITIPGLEKLSNEDLMTFASEICFNLMVGGYEWDSQNRCYVFPFDKIKPLEL